MYQKYPLSVSQALLAVSMDVSANDMAIRVSGVDPL
jgi:hypothetical protein